MCPVTKASSMQGLKEGREGGSGEVDVELGAR